MQTHMAIDVEAAAREWAGNWQKFESFAWQEKPENSGDWLINYTHHRDSRLLDLSNAAAIEKILESYTEGDDPDVRFESHNHFAYGHADGFSLRVYRDGQITPAFQTFCDYKERLENYPVLDEEDYSARENEATLNNIKEAAADYCRRLHDAPSLPDDFVSQVHDWFSQNLDKAIENRDDQGGYPNDKQLEKAFLALKWLVECEECSPSTHHGHCYFCGKRFDHEGETNPLTGHEFCSVACFDDGYDGRRKGVEP